MAKIDKKSTILRQWTLLRKLTVNRASQGLAGRWDKTVELQQRLADEGFEVSVRTVQRDLQALMEIFPIEVNDLNPRDYGWRWQKDVQFDIPGMTTAEALMLNLTEMHLEGVMPANLNNRLNGLFEIAKQKLKAPKDIKAGLYKDWTKKIHIAPATLQLIAPTIDPDVQVAVYQALFEDNKIDVQYTPMNAQESKTYTLNPLGLINRGNVYYLVASAWQYDNVTLYALHRFEQVRVLPEATRTPANFNLSQAVHDGLAEFRVGSETIQLVLNCDASIINYIKESALSEDQTAVEKGQQWIVTATVNNTWELRNWILSYSFKMEVMAPVDLRAEIQDKLTRGAERYM